MEPTIQYFVIHNRTKTERYKNILKQQETLGKSIEIVDAIMGNSLKPLHQYDQNCQQFVHLLSNEVGCYMSHFMIFKTLLETLTQPSEGYTVIFEDDFTIVHDDLHGRIIQMINEIKDIDIDILYLGTICDHKGSHFKEDIYHINVHEHLWGTHAYLVKNSSLHKILHGLLHITNPLDLKYRELFARNVLHGLSVSPSLVNQNNDFPSYVRQYCETTKRYIDGE